MKKITKEFMINNRGCYSLNQLSNTSFMKIEGINFNLNDIIISEIPLKDKFWFICKKLNTKELNQRLAIDVAMITLKIFEDKYPTDLRPREALEFADKYLRGECTLEELREKRADTAAAVADAYAANAAAAAVADVADADAYAAATYAAAYTAAYAYKTTLQEYLVEFCNQNHIER